MFVFKAAVVGAGTMGGEIAQAVAAADIPVVLKDIDQKFVDQGLEKAREVTQGQLARLVKKEKLTQEQADAQLEAVMGRIEGTTSYDSFGDVDFVIEAAPERIQIKETVFKELDAVTPGHAILASNTSSLSITEMADATLRPDKVVGFHFFYPASVMPLLEIIEGLETSPETVATALNFAQAIRKQPITCNEVPGFVVNRILISALGEVMREQETKGLSIAKIDHAISEAKAAPMGPFFLNDLLGLDTVCHVAEHLNESYGDSFYVHTGLQKLVSEGKLGAKSGGSGFFENGEAQIPGDAEPDKERVVELMWLKSLVEACSLIEEGVAGAREIDLGMMAGAGMDPRRGLFPPFMKADITGLDVVLEKLEAYEESDGERFAPPITLRRLVQQGRLGTKSGQGFYAYPQSDPEHDRETIKLERRDGYAIAWLANAPMNSISPQVISDLHGIYHQLEDDESIRALVIASAIPVVFSAGADIKGFTQMDESSGAEMIDTGHALFRELGEGRLATIAAVNAIAYGGGCELAMACDFRIAAESAMFGQPEIKLGLIPGLGGTQRLPRLVGAERALEMNLTGDAITAESAYEIGLVTRVVPDHELFDTAVAWARKLAAQAPLAMAGIKRVSGGSELADGIEDEKQGFADAFATEDAKEGISAFLGKRSANWKGK
ncbi:hypothetical protein HJD18_11200 [Thermoleophilia bacterium SCSIO 60948]|nr:hypothetical protein HJD18_11200 [Thermoleophilia bacterium SCSIO 60948]